MISPDRQAEQQGGGETSQRVPESLGIGNLLWVHPAELMRDNPAALILNTESYNRISASFAVDQFDPPQVVRVKSYSTEGQEVTRMFVVDGHTRTKYAADHPDIIVAAFRFESIPVRDVTASQLRSPIVVPENERQEGQQSLTMVQYLRAVIPPTIEHSQIAPERIAAHLMNGWRNMVGPDLASRFSAIAALSLLENPRVPIATDVMLNRFLTGQTEIMAGETPEERTRLQKVLLDMASIVRQTKLFREKIAESAFLLVASRSSVIGGEREALKEVYGLLQTPSIEQKLAAVTTQAGEKERLRSQLGQFIIETFRLFTDNPDRTQNISVVSQILKDPNLSLGQINDILTTSLPNERYISIKQEINLDKLKSAYLKVRKSDVLSETEVSLVNSLGRKTFLSEQEIQNSVRAISTAAQTIEDTHKLMNILADKKNGLLSRVSTQTMKEAVRHLEQLRENLIASTSSQTITGRTRELRDAITEIEGKLKREVGIFKVGKIVDEVYEGELTSGFGPQIRNNIIFYILREIEDVSIEAIVKQRITMLKNLDNDLQSKVLSGEIRLVVANRMQSDRRTNVNASSEERKGSSRTITPASGNGPRTSTPIPPTSPFDDGIQSEELTRREVEERRKSLNNEKLNQGLTNLRSILSTLDLELIEITTQNITTLDEIINKLGRLRFNHPDIIRVIDDYQKRIQEETKIREAQLGREREETDRDTRTGR